MRDGSSYSRLVTSVWILAGGCSPEAALRCAAEQLGGRFDELTVAEAGTTLIARVPAPRESPSNAELLPDAVHVTSDAPPSWTPSLPSRTIGPRFATDELDHTADEGFLVAASGRGDVLAAAAEALASLMVEPDSIELRERRGFDAAGDEASLPQDERLFRLLSEILWLMDGERFAIRRVVLTSDDEAGIRGFALGEPLDEERHGVRGAIKAITYHGMQIEHLPGGTWRAQVIVDV